jgi:zinc transport system substrate-binding protein
MRLAATALSLCLAATALSLCLAASPALAAPKVIASVVPVHGIVSAVMGEIGQPDLLLSGSLSEHRATYTPQQIADLGKADLVFIIGQGLEAKLSQISGSEAVNGKRFVELSTVPGIVTHPIREGGAWEAHDHDHDHGHGHDHDHGEKAEGVLSFDPHVWLDPGNAKAMAAAVAAELATADPANAAAYARNAEAFTRSLAALSGQIAAELAPVQQVPYVVFHDAYQYFEKRFGLNAAGSISDVSASAPSAKRLKQVRGKIKEVKAACVFREPQYDGKMVETVIEGTGAKAGVLDPLGAGIPPGPEAYQQLLTRLSGSLKACLSG